VAIAGADIAVTRLARGVDAPPNRITGALHVNLAITADTALQLRRCFGTGAIFWINRQQIYDPRLTEQEPGDGAGCTCSCGKFETQMKADSRQCTRMNFGVVSRPLSAWICVISVHLRFILVWDHAATCAFPVVQ
jgi:plasmid maintenance system antidote protein VapI